MEAQQEHIPVSDSVEQKLRKHSFDMLDLRRPSMSGTIFNTKADKERKIGHRRVDEAGQVTYKKRPTSELMAAIQLGIGQSVGSLSPKPMRDVLYEDFHVVETVFFPREGSNLTPAHRYNDFRFKTYAPIAFRYFRELFKIQAADFLLSLCDESLLELSNPGASGSIFYISEDDEFIIKTVQHKEADFLQKLLPGYYMNLNQNPCTFLPKFYGLYCYQCGGKNIRFVVMNNLLPSSIQLHEKYDLKGSTHKRKASKQEKIKANPTLKDLDFLDLHQDGILLEPETYYALIKTMDRDCRVLESFKIMDYSLLLGIQNMSLTNNQRGSIDSEPDNDSAGETLGYPARSSSRFHRPRLAQYSTAMEAIQGYSDQPRSMDIIAGGIPAVSTKGDPLLLYVGVIDILQSYRFVKKFEHAMKALVHDGDTISVHHPGFYAQRFQSFCAQTVFKNKNPMKRKSIPGRKSLVPSDNGQKLLGNSNNEGPVNIKRPDVLPRTTPTQQSVRTSATTSFSEIHYIDEGGSDTPLTTLAPNSSATKSVSHEVLSLRPMSLSLYKQHRSEEHLTISSQIKPTTSAISLASTPNHTFHTDATMSYTASSVSVIGSYEHVIDSKDQDVKNLRSQSLNFDDLSLEIAIEDEMTYL